MTEEEFEQFVSDGENTYGGKVVVNQGLCPRVIPWEQPDSANVQNLSGLRGERPAGGRSPGWSPA